MKIRQAVILAGGRGERLRPITDSVPKPMVPVLGRPFLEYLIDVLKENAIQEVVLLLGYLPEKITEHFGDGSKFGLNIKYSVSDVSNETGTRLRKAEHLLEDKFLLMYCDNYWPLDLKSLSDFYEKQNVLASVTIYSNKQGVTKNNILVDDKGYVVKYDKSRQAEDLNGVEIGFFILDKKVLDLCPDNDFNFEKEIFPKLILQNQLAGYLTDQRYQSISTPERVAQFAEFVKPKKAIFLDRDGVVNKKPPRADYVKKWEEFEWLPGAIEGLKILSDNNYDIYFISNQPGIARGVMTHEDLKDVQGKMEEQLEGNGVKIAGTYYCLHGWDDNCDCRKPKPGLLLKAAQENNLDLRKVFFLGDDERDVMAGEAAGCMTIFLGEKNDLLNTVKKLVQES